MEFDIHKRKRQITEGYSKDVLDIAYEFSKRLYKEFSKFIKVIALFGSTARKKHLTAGDLDILVIVDDVTVVLDKEFVEAYMIIISKIVAEASPRKLHVTTLKFTSFWEYVRAGDPVAVNILRDGMPIIDSGVFEPLQLLLMQGRIRPSPESTWAYFNKAPMTINNSKGHVVQATLDLYWAVIDAAHAALMRMNEVPPSPEHVADLLDEKLVTPGLLEKKHSQIVRKFYDLSRLILHGRMVEVKGADFDKYLKEAQEFVSAVEKFLYSRK